MSKLGLPAKRCVNGQPSLRDHPIPDPAVGAVSRARLEGAGDGGAPLARGLAAPLWLHLIRHEPQLTVAQGNSREVHHL